MDNVKFKQKVLPGDTLIFKAELISPIRRGICHMQSYGYANGKLVVEAELMAQIAKKPKVKRYNGIVMIGFKIENEKYARGDNYSTTNEGIFKQLIRLQKINKIK